MSPTFRTKLVLTLFTSLAIAIVTTSRADKPKPAQAGIVTAGGNLSAGGNVNYNFTLSATTAGVLQVKASIKLGSWKSTFTNLDATAIANLPSLISGPYTAIPTNVQGDAVLKVKAKFNKKNILKRSISVHIGPALPAPSSVSTNLLDVGFGNSVTLNAAFVPTTGMGATPTYLWQQIGGNPVSNSTAGAALRFTTEPITTFVTFGSSIFTDDGTFVPPELRYGAPAGVPLTAQQVAQSTYTFQVLVSGSSITRTGLFNVVCSSQTPAQPNIPVGVTAYYKGETNSTNWSLVIKPAGSNATLTHGNELNPQLRPDMEGVYVIQDNVTGQSVTNTAASWTGVQFCATCHGPNSPVGQEDIVTPWSQTGHASFFQRAIDGQTLAGQHYNEKQCIYCHTVGYNKAPTAVNGGFDDVAKSLGWQFPTLLQPGNFAAMPSQLQNKSNIQCENCHGPGSRHPGEPSVTLAGKVCASCHQDGDRHNKPSQWAISPHAGGYETIGEEGFGSRSDCARCHSPVGFSAVASGEVSPGLTNQVPAATAVPTGVGPLTCQTCHDPHDSFDDPERMQLVSYDTVKLGFPLLPTSPTVTVGLGDPLTTANLNLTNSTVTVTNTGSSAACMICHNARQWPTQIQISGRTASNIGKMYYQTGGPHDQTAGEAFAGIGAYDYGQWMGNSFHTYLAKCQTCHMYKLQATDTITVDDVPTNGAAFANKLGDHTFMMSYDYTDTNAVAHTADNIAACNQCHNSFETVDSFDFRSATMQDYDGNTKVEGVQTETRGLLNILGFLLRDTGVSITTNTDGNVIDISTSTGYSTNAVLREAQRKAAWNWFIEYREGSFGVHNTQFTIKLLQSTLTDLNTNYTGNVTNTYGSASFYPNAALRR